MVDNKFLPKLSQNLLEILNEEEYYDITIEVGKDPDVRIFRSHKVILYYRSPYLNRILSTNKKKDNGTLTHIELPDILPEIFSIILRYIYGGKLSLKDYDTSDIIKILDAASKLSLQELINYLQSYLIEKKANWIKQNFSLIYQASFEDISFFKLQKYCTDLISKQPDKIFRSLNFSSTPENLLISLLQNDKLQLSDIQIWEYVLKWGLAQNPELPSNLKSFSNENFETLKNTLQQFIPFIKFYNLTSKEYLDKVFPYNKILPKKLSTDLIKNFLNPTDYEESDKSKPHMTKEIKSKIIDSKIITYQHVELITKWINRFEIMNQETSYEFKLLFRGSRDGFSTSKFHELCDNKFRTITVVKVKDSKEILGGYNPIIWESDESGLVNYGTTKDSFIFSFEDDQIENYILSRLIDEKYAIYNNILNGPSFGSKDFILRLKSFFPAQIYGFCKKKSYYKSIRKTEDKFSVEECEVFQL